MVMCWTLHKTIKIVFKYIQICELVGEVQTQVGFLFLTSYVVFPLKTMYFRPWLEGETIFLLPYYIAIVLNLFFSYLVDLGSD